MIDIGFAFVHALSSADFEAQVTRFLDVTRFVTDGAEIEERTKLMIAALACRLTLALPDENYTRLEVISIVDELADNDDGHLLDGMQVGAFLPSVTFTRSALARAFVDDDDGKNIVYHELAHVLDAADGISDGIPPLLLDPSMHDRWRDVLARELARLRAAVELGIPTALDPYGKKNEVELFAVATEAFFERPRKMRNAHPDLYELLASFYRQRP